MKWFHYSLKCSCPPSSKNGSPLFWLIHGPSSWLWWGYQSVIHSPLTRHMDCSGRGNMGQAGSESFPKIHMGISAKRSTTSQHATGAKVWEGAWSIRRTPSPATWRKPCLQENKRKPNGTGKEGHEGRETKQGLENDAIGQEELNQSWHIQREFWKPWEPSSSPDDPISAI